MHPDGQLLYIAAIMLFLTLCIKDLTVRSRIRWFTDAFPVYVDQKVILPIRVCHYVTCDEPATDGYRLYGTSIGNVDIALRAPYEPAVLDLQLLCTLFDGRYRAVESVHDVAVLGLGVYEEVALDLLPRSFIKGCAICTFSTPHLPSTDHLPFLYALKYIAALLPVIGSLRNMVSPALTCWHMVVMLVDPN